MAKVTVNPFGITVLAVNVGLEADRASVLLVRVEVVLLRSVVVSFQVSSFDRFSGFHELVSLNIGVFVFDWCR